MIKLHLSSFRGDGAGAVEATIQVARDNPGDFAILQIDDDSYTLEELTDLAATYTLYSRLYFTDSYHSGRDWSFWIYA